MKPANCRLLFLMAMTVALAFDARESFAALNWNMQQVFVAPSTYSFDTSLALDSGGNPHIAYTLATDNSLHYASLSNGVWDTVTVDSGSVSYLRASLALNSQGQPGIVYGLNQGGIRYATAGTGGWSTSDIAAGDANSGDIVYSVADSPVISFNAGGQAKIATRNAGTWSVQVAESQNACYGTSLALNSSGNQCVAYWLRGSTSTLKFAVWNGSSWTNQTVDTISTEAQGDLSLAFDRQGVPHILYNATDGLQYATLSGGTWVIQTVASRWLISSHNSLAFDQNNRPVAVFAYNDGSTGQNYLRYATFDGAAWQTDVLRQSGTTSFGYTDIAVDGQNRVHISYWASGVLNYGVGTPEPATLSLLVMGGLAMLRRRK